MDYAHQEEEMAAFLYCENVWHHAAFFVRRFEVIHGVKLNDVHIRKLCKSIRHDRVGKGSTVISTIERGYFWSCDVDEINVNADYWKAKALTRLETSNDIRAAIDPIMAQRQLDF